MEDRLDRSRISLEDGAVKLALEGSDRHGNDDLGLQSDVRASARTGVRYGRTREGRSSTRSFVLRRKFGFSSSRIFSTFSGVRSANSSLSSVTFAHALGSGSAER